MRLHMRLQHAARASAGLLAFAVGTASAGLRPAPARPSPGQAPPAQVEQAPPAPAAVRPAEAAAVSVDDTARGGGPRVTQTLWVTFPKTGLVQVRAVENYGERMRIEVLHHETDALLYSFPAPAEEQPDAAYGSNPFLRFRVVRAAGLPRPLILVVAVTPGGTGHGFQASLVGEVGGRLKLLTRELLATNNQGGVHVGDLGGGRGPGVAVWTDIWDTDCEAHYGAHRFEVEYYPFEVRRGRFVKGRTARSRQKYGGHGEGALRELGLDYTDLLQDMPDISDYYWL